MNRKKTLLGMAILWSLLLAQGVFAAEKVELNLTEVVEKALVNEPRIGIADANMQSAQGSRRVAWGSGGLNVGYDFNAGRGKSTNFMGISAIGEKYGSTIKASVPIYTGGAVSGAVDQADGGYKASEYNYDRMLQQVKLDATNAYFNVLATKDVVKLSKESVDRLNAHLKNVKAQFEVGTVAKVDVLRSQVEMANAEQILIKNENAYDVAVAMLLNMIGLPLDTELTLKEELKYENYTQSLESCMDYAMKNRPDLYAAAYLVEGAKGGIKAAKSGYLPKVAAFAQNSWAGNSFPGNDNSSWTVGATMNLNILDTGVTAGKVDQAQGNMSAQLEQQRQIILNAALEVKSAYLGLREAEKRIGTAEIAVNQAEEDYKIAQLRYQAGVGTNVDLLDSQVALTQAKNNHVGALYSYNTSKAQLDKAMGIPTGKELPHKYAKKASIDLAGAKAYARKAQG